MKAVNIIIAMGLLAAPAANAQFDLGRALQGGIEAIQAATLTDAQVAQYVAQSVAYMDQQNKVLPASSPYVQRLNRITSGITEVDGTPLNFKVYQTDDVNAFACADGSVRVYTGLMDLMTDDEVLGVIGHEVGHVALHHSRNAFKKVLLHSAILDGIASTSSTAAALTDSQLSQLTEAYMQSSYSRKQETQADDYGYEFLKQHNKNPWALAHAFEKLQALEQKSGSSHSQTAQMFADHPDTASRIADIEARCKKDGIAENATYSEPKAVQSDTKTTVKKSKDPRIPDAVTSPYWTF